MTLPLMMLGPGGDYVTRYEPHGQKLLKRIGETQGHTDGQDTESGSSYAGYVRYPRNPSDALDDRADPSPSRDLADRYEPSDEPPPLPGDRAAADRWMRAGALALASAAITSWLTQQQRVLADASAALRAMRTGPDSSATQPAPKLSISPADSERDDADALPDDHAIVRRLLRQPFVPDLPDHLVGYGEGDAEESAELPRMEIETRLFPDFTHAAHRRTRASNHKHITSSRPISRSGQNTLFGAAG